MSGLDSFITSSVPLPECIATSTEIEDRESIFVGHIYRAASAVQARAAQAHLKRTHAKKPASHEIYAYRCMALKKGRDGLGEDDFRVEEGIEDDGESWAGSKILKVMKDLGVIDAVVIVSRWYGGIMLGPVRFTHIEDCTREVCRAFAVKDELDDCIATLKALDETLTRLRSKLEAARAVQASSSHVEPTPGSVSSSTIISTSASISASTAAGLAGEAPLASSPAADFEPLAKKRKLEQTQDYADLRRSIDVKKAKRLITARENSTKAVQKLLDKAMAKEPAIDETSSTT